MTFQEYTSSVHNFEECMKCTICTAYCPVVPVNPDYPGPKQAGPDGERLRLSDPLFFNRALKYCLNCKRCEVVCPSGVKVGDLIQEARLRFDNSKPKLRDHILASTDFMGTMARPFAPIVNMVTGMGIAKAVMDGVLAVDKHRTFPKYSSTSFEKWLRKQEKVQGSFPRQVAYFHGCYVEYNNPQQGKDLVKVLNALGVGVQLLEGEKCCGVAAISNRLEKQACKNAQANLEAIGKAVAQGLTVVNLSSSCTFAIRDEYPSILKLDNSAVKDSVVLATRYIWQLLESGTVELHFKKDLKPLRIAYHTPCHMQKLGWSMFSKELLKLIPNVELIPLEQNCCGIAGTYGFKKENYETSMAIGEKLFEQIRKANPDIVATDCETCRWQIEMGTGYPVRHPVSLFADALEDPLA